jgi:serralysin
MTAINDYLSDGDDHYESDWALGRVEVGGDAMLMEASVDGQGGTLRSLPVFTIDQAAYYLNRGAGPQLSGGVYYNSGANWAGAQGSNNWYFLPTSKTNGGEANDAATQFRLTGRTDVGPTGPLTQINFGFYESLATLPDPYVFTRLSDGTNQQYIGDARANGFSAFSAAQREAARQAMEAWDDLIAISLVETHFSQGDINFMNTTTGPIQASAFLPYGSSTSSVIIQDDGTRVTTYERVGDVFINPNQASNMQFDEGQYGLTTLIHEIGHSLGLEHPGAYNFGPGFAVTYENGAEYYQDSAQYSIMSYWDAEETGANRVNWEFLTYNYASTPSVHDVAAIQRIYGADMTTRTGDNVYGFNTTEKAFGSFDFVNNLTPVVTIWDAGGNDTLDLSGYNTPSVIDLNPGQFSSAGGFFSSTMPTLAEINARRVAAGLSERSQAAYDQYVALFGETYKNGLLSDNIAIAYGVTIENAIGGAGDDKIIGNSANNLLKGNGGNDRIEAGLGNDTLDGGTGSDQMLGGFGDDLYMVGEVGDVVTELSNEGTDTVRSSINYTLTDNVEHLILEAAARNGTGNGLNNVIIGNDHRNVLSGGAGNDVLRGGKGVDVHNGGAGNDVIVIEEIGSSVASRLGSLALEIINDFNALGDDTIDLSALGNFTFKGTSANKAAGDLTYKTYNSVNGAENALGIDIDGIDGVSNINGPVTVVLANLDGGAPDLAIVLMNTNGVSASDFASAPSASVFGTGSGGLSSSYSGSAGEADAMLRLHDVVIA